MTEVLRSIRSSLVLVAARVEVGLSESMAGFAALFEELRGCTGWSKRQWAIKAGLPAATVGDLLLGKGRRLPRWELVQALVDAAVECAPSPTPAVSAERLALLMSQGWWRDQHDRLRQSLETRVDVPPSGTGLPGSGVAHPRSEPSSGSEDAEQERDTPRPGGHAGTLPADTGVFVSDDDDLEREMNPLRHLPWDVDHSLNTVLVNRDMSAMTLACYARWWQLEAWLRSAVYLELRSRDGADWASKIAGSARTRQKGDERYQYMASPDWADPLAYLETSQLFAVVEENWDVFAPILPHKPVWLGKVYELLAIRDRIGHLRRPHADDLGKLLQTLRDLERGALLSCCAYNEPRGHLVSDDDPVWEAYCKDSFVGAVDLCEHSDQRYGTAVELSYTLRPWAKRTEGVSMVTGHPGAIWQVAFYPRGREIDIRKFWAELNDETRTLLLHVTISTFGTVRVTFPAVESPESLSRAIGDTITSSMRSYAVSADSVRPPEQLPPMDSRVLLNTALAWVCSDYIPITLFSA